MAILPPAKPTARSLASIDGSYEINGRPDERRETTQAHRNETDPHEAVPTRIISSAPPMVPVRLVMGLIIGRDEPSRAAITSGARIERLADESA